MAKNANPMRSTYIAAACLVVATLILWSMGAQSVSISLVYRGKWIAFLVLAYTQLSLLIIWTLIRNDLVQKGFGVLSNRDRWWGVCGAVIGPLITSYVLLLLIPLVVSSFTEETSRKNFVYVTSEPYARPSRGLVRVQLVDAKGAEHWVVFKKERVEKLTMKCGDILTTVGRDSFLGYVIDSEARANGSATLCPQG